MADRALGLQVGSPHALDYAAALARDSPTALSALATSSSQAQGSAAGRAVPTKTSGAPEDANDQNSGAAAAGGARPQSDAVAAPVSSDWPADGAAPPPVAADQQLGQQPAAAQQAPQQQQQQPAVPPPFGELRSLSGRRAEVWGGLRPVPGCSRLPYVLLQGRGVAIGRGQDVYHERLPQLMLSRAASLATAGSASLGVGGAPDTAAPPPASPTALGSGGIASPRDCQFVEVADGRISRLHVWVRWDSAVQRAVLEDFSSNGTFINGLKVGCGRTAMLADGDRLSLVLSVAPLAELAFTFHQGDPRGQEGEVAADWASDAARLRQPQSPLGSSTAAEPGGGAPRRTSSSGSTGATAAAAAAAARLARCNTTTYSTLQATSLDDLQCQICLGTLRDCVSLQPCGHNACAACLSNYFASLLNSGQPLTCPLRCAPPEQVVANEAVRSLLARGPGPLLSQQAPSSPPWQARRAMSALEQVPEDSASGGSSSLPSTRQPSLPSAASSGAFLPHAAAGLLPLGEAAASAGSAAAPGVEASGGSGAQLEALSDDEYRRVVVLPTMNSSGASSMASPPSSPFESASNSRRFSRSSLLASGELDAAAAAAARQASGPIALAGAPTVGACSPLARAATQGSGAVGLVALPGEPTMVAGTRLELAPSGSVRGPTALPGQPSASASTPFASAGSGQVALMWAQGYQQQPNVRPTSGGQRDPAESSVGSSPGPAGAPSAASLGLPSILPPLASGGRSIEGPFDPVTSLLVGGGSSTGWGDADGSLLPMHPLCPLDDAALPLGTASLKSRQLVHSLELLQGAGTADAAMAQLEAIARLAWSDETAREELGARQGLEAVVASMHQHLSSEGVQCNGCLALMALVRGDGEASDSNRIRLADCGGVDAIADGMHVHLDTPMVQLSALLCLVPLALENTDMQVRVAKSCLPSILAAIQEHAGEAEVVSKGLIMLGVLGQGDEEAHEEIRAVIMEATPFPRIVASVLGGLGTQSEDVLWSALFALAVIARDTSRHYVSHMLSLAATGVLPALQAAMRSYRAAVEAEGTEPDEMICRAGDFLTLVLGKARKLLWMRRTRQLSRVAFWGLAAAVALRWMRQRAAHRASGGGRK